MRFIDLVRVIFDNLSRRKGRVVLTAIGVIIGTAAVVLLVSLANGLQKSATDSLYGIGDLKQIQVYPQYGDMSVQSPSGFGADAKLLTPDVIKEIEAIDGVEAVIPEDYVQGQAIISFGRMETYANIMGVGTTNLASLNLQPVQGSTELNRGTCIVGSQVSQNFYDPQQRPGQEPPDPPELYDQRLRLKLIKWSSDGQEIKKTVDLRVAGVLEQTNDQADYSILVRMEDLNAWNEWFSGTRINRNKTGYNFLVVRAENPEQVIEITDQITALGLQAYSAQSMVEGINSYFIILQLVFGGIGAIALLVAAIGIANTMTMAILERTREIGLMKALGATNKEVLSIFLGEAAGIGFIGGLGGAAFGWIGSKVLNVLAMSFLANQAANGGIPPSISTSTPIWLLIFAIVFATLVGLLSGLYPALRAATLEPVTALKYE